MEIEPARRNAVRLNVSIPGYAVNLIDQAAASVGASRSGFITKATLRLHRTGASAVTDRRLPQKAGRRRHTGTSA